jgi:hypothetical protein
LVLLYLACPLHAAEGGVEALLPASCAPGWVKDGAPATYTRESLYRYIDGEAELYMPYGFEKAATVMYAGPAGEGSGMVASIFRMGSLLDAFGIYAGYRGPGVKGVPVGAEGFADELQLMFYQDRYLVRIEVSGGSTPDAALLRSCAEAVSRNLPDGRKAPGELEFLKVPGTAALTDRYYPAGLLGYAFLGRGLTAEVSINGERAKSLVMLGASVEAAGRAFDEYGKYLKGSGVKTEISHDRAGAFLHGVDPMYKGVALRQSGRFIVGVTGLKEPGDGDGVVARLVERLPKG